MSYVYIDDPRKWRVSKSGFSIKTGWGDEKKIIAKYPGDPYKVDGQLFSEWLDNAEKICQMHNSTIDAAIQESKKGIVCTDQNIDATDVE